jgi:zinc transport system permease protein
MIEMLQHPFFQNALVAGILAAMMCSMVGVYVVLKRVVFVGITLAQLSSAGVALALLLNLHPTVLALSTTLAGVVFFSQVPSQRRLPLEAVIGASYILAAALGVIFIAKNPVGEARALNVLFGNILSVQADEIFALAVALVVLVVVHVVFYKEFLFVSFDVETARAQGIQARLWNLLLYLTLGFAIAFAIRSMGVLLVFTFLTIPAMTARLVANRMASLFTLAVLFGSLSVPLGLYLAFRLDLPTGTTVAATAVALLLLVLAGRGLYWMAWRWSASVALCCLALFLGLPGSALAQEVDPQARLQQVEQEMQRLRESMRTLQESVRAQQDLLQRQEQLLRQQESELEALRREAEQPPAAPPPAAPPPAPVVAAPSPGIRLPGGLLLNPEMRVEGNFIANKTFGFDRDAEAEGFPSDRFSLKNVEVGFRASVDPFAIFEAVFEGQRLVEIDLEGERERDEAVELETAHLTLPRLPLQLRGRLGLMRTSFGEYNDDDPEEFPEIDPPNMLVNLFGEEGEGWKDVGFNLNYQFGNPWSEKLTHLLWFGIYSGENDTAFTGGQSDKPVYFARAETFFELGPRLGAELGVSFAAGKRNAGLLEEEGDNGENGDGEGEEDAEGLLRGRLDTTLFNLHFEVDWQPAVYSRERGFTFLSEFFYSIAERLQDDDLHSVGGYALTQYRFGRWGIGARVDAAECPGFDNSLCTRVESDKPVEDRFEWAISPILSFSPSRFLTFRLQYKHTERNYAGDSDELLAQALFIIGYERPEPF